MFVLSGLSFAAAVNGSCSGSGKAKLNDYCMSLPDELCLPDEPHLPDADCGEEEFDCGNDQCVHGLTTCNHAFDCLNGADELKWYGSGHLSDAAIANEFFLVF